MPVQKAEERNYFAWFGRKLSISENTCWLKYFDCVRHDGQEVCIESGWDGSVALSSLGLSVCLVSHNLLYSGLKKAHSKMKSMKENKKPCMILMSTLGPLPCPSPQSESSSQMMVTRVQKVVYSNLYSQAVTHPSTNRSQPCLTSVIGQELVY